MKIDLHVHCKELSPCGRSSEEEQIIAAINSGLDAIVFTDHNLLMPKHRLKFFNQKYEPFQIFGGIEVCVVCNSDSHEESTIGKYYNILNRPPVDEAELIQILKLGDFKQA